MLKLCPSCGASGRLVKPVTLESLAADLPRPDGRYRFCATAGCDVAWFGEDGHRIGVEHCRVAIGQKSTDSDRTLCYCFEHTAADLAQNPDLAQVIAEACKRGEDRCRQTNPQGSCCLGNVHAALKLATKPSCCGS
jgi:hypothetical protein